MSKQISILELIAEGEALKEAGLNRAVDHAEREAENWKSITWELFKEFLQNVLVFRVEEFRSWLAEKEDYEFPPSARAFGFVSKRGVKEGLIEFAGFEKTINPLAHRTPVAIWRKI